MRVEQLKGPQNNESRLAWYEGEVLRCENRVKQAQKELAWAKRIPIVILPLALLCFFVSFNAGCLALCSALVFVWLGFYLNFFQRRESLSCLESAKAELERYDDLRRSSSSKV